MFGLILSSCQTMHSAAFLKLQSTGFKKDFAVKNMPDKEFVDKVHLWLATNLVSGKSALEMKSPELKTVVFNYDQSYETTFGFECSHCQMKMTVIVKKISANKGQVVFRNIRPQLFGPVTYRGRAFYAVDEDETIRLKKEFERIAKGIESEIN